MKRFPTLVLILILIMPAYTVSSSFIAPEPPLDQYFEASDFAFTGVAGPLTQGKGYFRYYEFTDVSYIKNDMGLDTVQIRISGGTVGETTVVTTAMQPSFVEGSRYLVFVRDNGGVFWTYYSPYGTYLLDDDPNATNVIMTRAESTVEMFLIAGIEPSQSPLSNHVTAYSVCIVLFSALILAYKK